MDVQGRMKELCTMQGWTVYRLSKESGIPYSSLENIFKRGSQPSISMLEKICDAFHIEISDFFSGQGSGKFTLLSEEEETLIRTYREMPKGRKSEIMDFCRFLKELE